MKRLYFWHRVLFHIMKLASDQPSYVAREFFPRAKSMEQVWLESDGELMVNGQVKLQNMQQTFTALSVFLAIRTS